MQAESRSIILLITQDTSLAAAMVPVFLGSGVRASIADHWTTNVSIAENLPTLLLMDAELPEGDIERMFSSARGPRTCLCRVVLMSDTVTDTWSKRLADGTIDDLIPRTPTNPRWRASLDSVLRAPSIKANLSAGRMGRCSTSNAIRLPVCSTDRPCWLRCFVRRTGC